MATQMIVPSVNEPESRPHLQSTLRPMRITHYTWDAPVSSPCAACWHRQSAEPRLLAVHRSA